MPGSGREQLLAGAVRALRVHGACCYHRACMSCMCVRRRIARSRCYRPAPGWPRELYRVHVLHDQKHSCNSLDLRCKPACAVAREAAPGVGGSGARSVAYSGHAVVSGHTVHETRTLNRARTELSCTTAWGGLTTVASGRGAAAARGEAPSGPSCSAQSCRLDRPTPCLLAGPALPAARGEGGTGAIPASVLSCRI